MNYPKPYQHPNGNSIPPKFQQAAIHTVFLPHKKTGDLRSPVFMPWMEIIWLCR